jgi:hypothetical protein
MDDPVIYTDERAEQAMDLEATMRVRSGGDRFGDEQIPIATLEVLAGILEELHVIEAYLRAAHESRVLAE